jgi:hypothetical protein
VGILRFSAKDIVYVVLIAIGSVLAEVFGKKYMSGYIAIAVGFVMIFAGAYLNHEYITPILYGVGAVMVAEPLAALIHL